MDFINIYLSIIIGGLSFILYKGKSIYNNVEHFLGPLKKIGSALQAVAEFFINFPDLFFILVDAFINFALNIVDLFFLLVDALIWIINLPIWVIDGWFYIITIFADLIILAITWLNPITMIKGVIKMILFLMKILVAFVFDMIVHLIRLLVNYIVGNLRSGLWGIPHGPKQHVEHRKFRYSDENRPIDEKELGYGEHHHRDHSLTDGDSKEAIYRPMRCYKGIGSKSFVNIVAMIICPPLGVFMSFGLSGWFKILICCALTIIYYFPGLLYALLITTHLGLGKGFKVTDCKGDMAGYIVRGCEKRKGKTDCEDAKVPDIYDKNGDPIKACVFEEDKGLPDGGTCMNTIFRGDQYNDLMGRKWDPNSEPDTYDHTKKFTTEDARRDGFD